MLCLHCENAPCEVVCPVEATAHSDEGLNDMIYNRCVGTRYCSNNCPYKVRRFNFLQYADYDDAEPQAACSNPDVTVRSRGVMEKCTFCVQRINARAAATPKEQDRAISDGEVVTACQAACPTEAIVFGDLNDPTSRGGAAASAEPHGYGLLGELNTRPRTRYLAALTNPNPELSPRGCTTVMPRRVDRAAGRAAAEHGTRQRDALTGREARGEEPDVWLNPFTS